MAGSGGSQVPTTSLGEVGPIQPIFEEDAEVEHGVGVASLGGS
jgi:hypothetical protein